MKTTKNLIATREFKAKDGVTYKNGDRVEAKDDAEAQELIRNGSVREQPEGHETTR